MDNLSDDYIQGESSNAGDTRRTSTIVMGKNVSGAEMTKSDVLKVCSWNINGLSDQKLHK